MTFIKAASFILLATAALSAPDLGLQVTKSSFLFIKWANFIPTYNVESAVTIDQASAQSKWYVFADYFGKLSTQAQRIALMYKINGAGDYNSYPLTMQSQNDNQLTFGPGLDLVALCKNNHNLKATIQKIELVNETFNVYTDINCDNAGAPTLKEGTNKVSKKEGPVLNQANVMKKVNEAIHDRFHDSQAHEVLTQSQLEQRIANGIHDQFHSGDSHSITNKALPIGSQREMITTNTSQQPRVNESQLRNQASLQRSDREDLTQSAVRQKLNEGIHEQFHDEGIHPTNQSLREGSLHESRKSVKPNPADNLRMSNQGVVEPIQRSIHQSQELQGSQVQNLSASKQHPQTSIRESTQERLNLEGSQANRLASSSQELSASKKKRVIL